MTCEPTRRAAASVFFLLRIETGKICEREKFCRRSPYVVNVNRTLKVETEYCFVGKICDAWRACTGFRESERQPSRAILALQERFQGL